MDERVENLETTVNILYKNYKGVPFTNKDYGWENELFVEDISGNTMFQNNYIILSNILFDEIPKEKGQIFALNTSANFDGALYTNSHSISEEFLTIDSNTKIYNENIDDSFCDNVLQYYNTVGNPVLQKIINLRLKKITGSKYNTETGKYVSWYRKSNDGTNENILKNSLPEFLGTWNDAYSLSDKNIPVYKYLLRYSKTNGASGFVTTDESKGQNGVIDKSKYNFDLMNGVVTFLDYENVKDDINETTPPLLTFVKYIGRKSKDIDDVVAANQTFNVNTITKPNFTKINRIYNNLISNTNDAGILLDLSGIGYLKVPYKDTVYPDDDIYKTIGAIRYDTLENAFEGFHGDSESGEWKPLGGGSGSTTDGSGTKILVYDVSKNEDENGYYTDKIQFYTNNQERMVINKDGDIQINGDIDMSTKTLKVNTLEVGSEIGDTLTAYDIYCDDITCNKIITNEDISCNKNMSIKENLYVHGDIHLDIDGDSNTVLQVLDKYVKDISNVLTNLILDAPEAFDTLKEISDQIKTDGTLDALIQSNLTEINKKYTGEDDTIPLAWLDTDLQYTINNAGAWSENAGDIYYNDAGNVGIGTTSPITKLDIRRDGGARLRLENSSGAYGDQNQAIEFCTTYATTGFIHQKGEDLRIGTIGGTSGKIHFYTNNASGYATGTGTQTSSLFNTTYTSGNDVPKMTIDLDGNVGIGTPSPTKYYDNQPFTTTDRILSIHGGDSSGSATAGVARLVLACDNYHTASIFGKHTGNGNTFMGFMTTLSTNPPEERMRIDSHGNVGIGTTDPKTALQIGHDEDDDGNEVGDWGTTTKHLEPGSLSIINNDISTDVDTKTIIDMARWGKANKAYGARCQIKLGRYSSDTGGAYAKTRLDFDLLNGTYNADLNTVMSLQANGNVGIGVTDPSTKLYIFDNRTSVEKVTKYGPDSISVESNTDLTGDSYPYAPFTIFQYLTNDQGKYRNGGGLKGSPAIHIVTHYDGIQTGSDPTDLTHIGGLINFSTHTVKSTTNTDNNAYPHGQVYAAIYGGRKNRCRTGEYEEGELIFHTSEGNNDGGVPQMTINKKGVGIGTTDPQQKLHIYKDMGSTEPTNDRQTLLLLEGQYTVKDFGGIPRSRREGGVGITFKLGNGGSQTYNPGYAAQIMAHCDELDDSDEHHGALSFWTSTEPGDNNSGLLQRMCINGNGNVGINATNPDEKLHVSGKILATDDITAFYGSSDKRLKTNINTIENAVEIVQQLRGVRFNWNEEARKINEHVDLEKKEIGVIAQEVEEHLPEIVKKGLSNYKAIRYEKITPLLIEAIKEQQQQIHAQQQQIKAQQQQINEILNRLNQHNA